MEESGVQIADLCEELGRLRFLLGAQGFFKILGHPPLAWVTAVDGQERLGLPWSVGFILMYTSRELGGDEAALALCNAARRRTGVRE